MHKLYHLRYRKYIYQFIFEMQLHILLVKWLVNSMSYYEEKLAQIIKDESQLEAYNSDKSTVVMAGPGSGKTTVLTLKIMKLLSCDITEPRGLACLTFSREAAREFETRLKKLGYKSRKNVFLGTVHSFCIAEVISKFANLYGYNIPNPVKIISSSDKKKLFYAIIDELGYGDQYLSITDMDKERMLGIKGLSKVEIPSYDIALKVATEYEKRLKKLELLLSLIHI